MGPHRFLYHYLFANSWGNSGFRTADYSCGFRLLIAIQMKRYLFWSAIFGAISGVCGTFISFLGKGIPTGPLIVLSSSLLFLIVLLFRPKKGAFFQWNHSRRSSIRIQMENTLKAIYQVLEQKNFQKNSITSIELMHRRGIGREDCEREIKLLIRSELASQRELSSTETLPGLSEITLTPEGWEYACKIVRNHRLWELYLTNEAEYDDDHVHEDAEKIEHLLGEKRSGTSSEFSQTLEQIPTEN